MIKNFQRRHYRAIAAALFSQRPQPHWDANKRVQWDWDVHAIANLFEHDNTSFQRDQFYDACGGLFNV